VTRTLGRAVTHGFSPPEQVLGTGTDVRSDVYALGAILYAALTGKTPPAAHERVTGSALAPPSSLLPDIPPLLDTAIRQALELNLNARQQTIAELARTLALVRSGASSERTVFAPATGTLTAGLGTSREIHLPSVQLPSTRQTSSQEIGQRGASSVALEARPRARSRTLAWLAVAVACAGFAVGGGWIYFGRLQESKTDSVAEPVAKRPLDAASEALPAVATQSGQTADAPGPVPLVAPSTLPQTSPPVSPAGEEHAEAPATAGRAQGEAIKVPASAGVELARTATALPGHLPAVFSDDQNQSTSPRVQTRPGSLIELYEQLRSERQPAEPAPAGQPAVATTDAAPDMSPASAGAASAKPVTTVKRERGTTPRKVTPPPRSGGGGGDWTGYRGTVRRID
jgi:eukaryotic-like serine/threonine-protein kinase